MPPPAAAASILAAASLLLAAGAALAQRPPQAAQPSQQQEPAPAPPPAPQDAGRRAMGASGLPLPRFAALEAREVNVRTGPGMQFPIRWVYTRPGLPVRILEEYDVWRLIEDPGGGQGWTHSNLLSTRRRMVVKGATQTLHRTADPTSRVVLLAEPGVVGELLNCDRDWCRVEIEGRRGWLPRANVWGVLPDEWRK